VTTRRPAAARTEPVSATARKVRSCPSVTPGRIHHQIPMNPVQIVNRRMM
jgi:hypothetical protein